VERAIAYEIGRQTKLIEEGGKVVQETRGWDEAKQETFHQRFKEGSADYRYFPEPDLPKLFISEVPEFSHEVLQASLPELPWKRRERYASYGIKEEDVEYLIATKSRSDFFDAVAGALDTDTALITLSANYVVSDLAGIYAKSGSENFASLDAEAFAKLIRLVAAHELSSRGAKDALLILVEKGGDPEEIAKEHNLFQVHDVTALGKVVDTVITGEEKAVAEYKGGKQASLQYLVGKAMKESRGAGNPQELQKLLIEKLG